VSTGPWRHQLLQWKTLLRNASRGCTNGRAVLISPAWGQIDLQELAGWVAASRLEVRMQLQLHKYIWDPEARGV